MRRSPDFHRSFSARAVEVFRAGPTCPEGLRIVAATAVAPAELLIYDAIGADFWGEGVTAKGVLSALAQVGGGPILVRVNSPGGDVFEGLAIYNALKAHPGAVNVQVDGLAASAASIIAMGGDTVTMAAGSMMMIHNASTIAYGDRNTFGKTAETLGKVDGQLAGIYATFSEKPAEHFAGMMDAETWMTADEAVAEGVATSSLAPPVKPKAEAPAIVAEVATPSPDVEKRRRRARLAQAH